MCQLLPYDDRFSWLNDDQLEISDFCYIGHNVKNNIRLANSLTH